MPPINRRNFIKILSAGTISGSGLFSIKTAFANVQPHVVIVGGGTGGATAAKYLKLADHNVKVTIVERNQIYHRCYGSNEVLTGHESIDDIAISYDALKNIYGINFVFDSVVGVEPEAQHIRLKNGSKLSYDRLIVSPGIDFIWDNIAGYTEDVANTSMPHAWKAGAQTVLLKRQVDAMPENGTMIIVPPANPFRCPPGPYERASLLAEMFKKKKPKAKILILDVKDKFTKDKPFQLGWNRLYGFNIHSEKMAGMPENIVHHNTPGMIEWIPGSEGGKVESVNPKAMTVHTNMDEVIKADVINVIPRQKAGLLAFKMGLTNKDGWCEINRQTFESTIHKKIHVIGDACVADVMPKSGYSANTQAKVCAVQVLQLLKGAAPVEPMLANTCFSRVGSEYGISVSATYRLDKEANKIISTKGSGGLSPLSASHAINRLEALYQESWMRSFVADCFL